MARIRKKPQLFEINHGMNFEKCAKIQQRIRSCERKRKSRSVKQDKSTKKGATKMKPKKKVTQ